MSWTLGLLQTMKDPNYVVIRTHNLVAIKDKFPKAKFHFLILPIEDIDTIFSFDKNHIETIKEMTLLAQNVIEAVGRKQDDFKIGFHAEPSMMRAHLHVVSKDFVSPCLKTKSHWNSFHTEFLWSPSKVINDLERFGRLKRLSVDTVEMQLNTPLKCTCSYLAKHMPDLKKHLLQHE